jgi:glycosyltransferase involved in cell wall biosynthesis
LKFLIIGPAFPLRGGIANFNTALYHEIVKQGHEAVIYSFSLQYPNFLFPGKSQFEDTEKPADINIKTVINSINPLNWIGVSKQIIKEKPDYIVVQFWMPFFAPSVATILKRAKRKLNVKIITISHNFFPHEKRIGDNLLLKYYTKVSKNYIALSESVKTDIENFQTNAEVKFIPHPIYNIFGNIVSKEESREFLKLQKEEKIVLFFGIIRQYKGLDLLIESIHKIKKLNIKVIVAGEFYEDKKRYIDQINKYELQNSFIILDEFVKSEEIKYYFCASDIVVQPYLSATQSGVTQIGYHFERPMLVTNVGGLAEIVPHMKAGYVCERNAQEIADSIIDFYENNREEQFVKFVSEYKENFNWNKLVQGILEFN